MVSIEPVAPFASDPAAYYTEIYYWPDYPNYTKLRFRDDFWQFNNEYCIFKSVETWASPEGESYTFSIGEVGKTVTATIHWRGVGNPGYKSIVESMSGGTYAEGSAYYDFFHTQFGYADADVHSAIGVKIIGSTAGGNNESEHQGSEASSGVQTKDDDGGSHSYIGFISGWVVSWPPSFSTLLQYQYQDDNPYENHTEYFLSPSATNAGYFDTWTIYWQLRGPSIDQKVRGCEIYGYHKYPSYACSRVSAYFTPNVLN